MDFLGKLLFNHWPRKMTSLVLAIAFWLVVNQSLTTTKTLDNVSVRLINIPAGMTVDGLLPSNMLDKKISLTIQGNKNHLKDLTSNDLEIVLDATDKSEEWLATISRKNLVSLNPDIDLSKTVKRILVQRFSISFTKLITEKIPVVVTHPVGEAPRDYQFLDVWPYRLSLTVSGPEDKIREVKMKGINLTFNLNDISRNDLEEEDTTADEISFRVPEDWKQVMLPSISDLPIAIDDPQAQDLRIDFIKSDFHPIAKPIPISLFFPPDINLNFNPESYSIVLGGLVEQFRGLSMIRSPLFARGTSRLFVELVQDMLQLSVIINPKNKKLDWCIQFQNHRVLEDRYVSILLSDEEHRRSDPYFAKQRQEYLRNRFRNYMSRLQLFKSQTDKLDLLIELDQNHIRIQEASDDGKKVN